MSSLNDTDAVQRYDGATWKPVGGKVLQVVTATSTTAFATTSGSFVDTNLSASITPSASSSRVLVIASFPASVGQNSNSQGNWTILRAGVNLGDTSWGIARLTGFSAAQHSAQTMCIFDSPSATVATIYKVQGRNQQSGIDATMGANGSLQTITLIEVAA